MPEATKPQQTRRSRPNKKSIPALKGVRKDLSRTDTPNKQQAVCAAKGR